MNKTFKQFMEQIVQEQMVVPRSIKKKNPLMTVETEKEILMQLSNRPAIYHRARTGRTMPPFSEGMLPKTEKGINSAMKKGLDKLDQRYQREYDDRKYPLDKKA